MAVQGFVVLGAQIRVAAPSLTWVVTTRIIHHACGLWIQLERPQRRCTDHFSNIVAEALWWVGMRLSA